MTCTTAASSRSPSACTGSRRISPARAGSRLDRERWEHAALSTRRNPSPSDGSSEEWSFVAPSLALLPEEVSQRKHDLREGFNGLRSLVKTAVHWRMLPHDLPPLFRVG